MAILKEHQLKRYHSISVCVHPSPKHAISTEYVQTPQDEGSSSCAIHEHNLSAALSVQLAAKVVPFTANLSIQATDPEHSAFAIAAATYVVTFFDNDIVPVAHQ
eukprot:CAMPEP_0118667604 /NCGR_PEP_ID=MMETSP0785-20121206/19882_1 /TAXON_ID=91992 /ORGANISM="Bolidomonas pacifica, Strain CCMP 1866" /LENGTH=103 /DNA_ID=CAMNT_0006562083 /DNA_START=2215 /DNA_END=2526 /DNA_ORIENTATION=-